MIFGEKYALEGKKENSIILKSAVSQAIACLGISTVNEVQGISCQETNYSFNFG